MEKPIIIVECNYFNDNGNLNKKLSYSDSIDKLHNFRDIRLDIDTFCFDAQKILIVKDNIYKLVDPKIREMTRTFKYTNVNIEVIVFLENKRQTRGCLCFDFR